MPFTPDYHWEIMRILDVSITPESEQYVKGLLQKVEKRSEIWVNQIKALVSQIKEYETSATDASLGLVQVDVIRWETDRYCSVMKHLEHLRNQLARAIGYPIQTYNPFGGTNTREAINNEQWCANKLRCGDLFKPHDWW